MMIMQNEFLNPFAQRLFAKPDHAVQTGLLDAAHEPLGVGIQIRRARRQRHRRYPDPLQQHDNSLMNSGSRYESGSACRAALPPSRPLHFFRFGSSCKLAAGDAAGQNLLNDIEPPASSWSSFGNE